MISFNRVALGSVAPVMIEDIRISPIQYNPVARERAISGGSDFVRMRNGVRTISVTFAVLSEDPMVRQKYLSAINSWARTDKEYRLDIAYMPDRYLMCVCTSKPEPSMRQWWESKLRIVFTCFDNPYWNSAKEKSVACGTAFYVNGDAPPLMRIEKQFSSTASNQTYTMAVPQGGIEEVLQTMTFTSIPTGSMVIDLNRETAVSGHTNIMQYYTYTSQFIQPRSGNQVIHGDGTIRYTERWT